MFTEAGLEEISRRLDGIVQDKPEEGILRARRDMFTDPELFELEMKHIWEGNWIYLAHESQIPNVNDTFTTHIGRQPIMITRDKTGALHALINACSHRGAMLCRHKRQNKATFTCPFHGWTFNNTGKLLKVKDPEGAGYPEQFNKNGSHDLKRVALFESYRGFLFGSLNPDVLPLSDYLGEAKVMIDMVADQSDEGLEVLRGSSTYTYQGNWKLQAENGADGYHVSAVHWNYVATTSHRADEGKDEVKSVDASKWNKQKGGFYSFDNGHLVLWTKWADPSNRPLAPRRAAPRRVGGEIWRGKGRLDDRLPAQPLPLSQPVPDGSILQPTARLPPDQRGSDRSHHLLHRPQGREPRGPHPPHPPVRGLLQRLRHGDTG